jgi:hypothetical protein
MKLLLPTIVIGIFLVGALAGHYLDLDALTTSVLDKISDFGGAIKDKLARDKPTPSPAPFACTQYDTLLQASVKFAMCYQDGKVVETMSGGGNLYEATATNLGDYDTVRVYRYLNDEHYKEYKGKLYFAARPRCC